MTAIIGLVHDGKVYIGADSATESGGLVHVSAASKVFTLNALVIGTTGSIRYRQIIQRHVSGLRPPTDVEHIVRYLVVEFIPLLRNALKEHGFTKSEAGQESADYGAMLVGCKGELLRIDCDFSVLKFDRTFEAIGSGSTLALGAMAALSPALAPEKRMNRALAIAAEFDPYVRPPFVIRNTGEIA